jgi:hypothetical protein
MKKGVFRVTVLEFPVHHWLGPFAFGPLIGCQLVMVGGHAGTNLLMSCLGLRRS